ncbi:hypothetical protein E4U54_000720 [Claviceps lovelessii]|nr:hypothetical protein E4U54_000720 [Claviceps lovelessii]
MGFLSFSQLIQLTTRDWEATCSDHDTNPARFANRPDLVTSATTYGAVWHGYREELTLNTSKTFTCPRFFILCGISSGQKSGAGVLHFQLAYVYLGTSPPLSVQQSPHETLFSSLPICSILIDLNCSTPSIPIPPAICIEDQSCSMSSLLREKLSMHSREETITSQMSHVRRYLS